MAGYCTRCQNTVEAMSSDLLQTICGFVIHVRKMYATHNQPPHRPPSPLVCSWYCVMDWWVNKTFSFHNGGGIENVKVKNMSTEHMCKFLCVFVWCVVCPTFCRLPSVRILCESAPPHTHIIHRVRPTYSCVRKCSPHPHCINLKVRRCVCVLCVWVPTVKCVRFRVRAGDIVCKCSKIISCSHLCFLPVVCLSLILSCRCCT